MSAMTVQLNSDELINWRTASFRAESLQLALLPYCIFPVTFDLVCGKTTYCLSLGFWITLSRFWFSQCFRR